MKKYYYLLIAIIFTSAACTDPDEIYYTQPAITADDILTHVSFLASDSLQGREAGTAEESIASSYIADLFRDYGLEPAGENDTYLQSFTINMSVLNNPHGLDAGAEDEKRIAQNVVGLLKGSGSNDDLIIVGAHYDHLGMGEFGSLYSGSTLRIHNGADDNASGTAGLLEIAEYFSENPIQSDLLFVAFSGEEMGLLGSQHFVDNPSVDLSNALAMINMDMIGRMNDNDLMIFGTGTAEEWPQLITAANKDSLDITMVSGGVGSSDHTSFYYKNIPVLHYFTDTHADYHRPSDDIAYINEEGEQKILEHLARLIIQMDAIDKADFEFIAEPGEERPSMRIEGPTLGVLPDYGYEGEGMKITGVTQGGPAASAGLEAGDIIVELGGIPLKDIYDYMGALNALKKGQETTIKIIRSDQEMTLNLQL